MNVLAPIVSGVSIVSTPHRLILVETGVMHDGEPVFALAWSDTPKGASDRSCASEGNRWGSCTTLNRNIGDPSTVTPEADQ